MALYSILFRASVEKAFRTIPRQDRERILARIQALASNPRPPGCEKLTGTDRYRVRQGNYRILYSILNKELTVWIVKIGHRRDVYRE